MKEPVGNIDGVGARSEGGSSSMSRGGDEGGEVQLKKGPWSAEEDAMLIDHVSKYGERNWNAVHELSGLPRCGKSCRVRWTTYLRPNAKEGAFSAEEDRIIDELDDQISASNDDEGGGGDLKKGAVDGCRRCRTDGVREQTWGRELECAAETFCTGSVWQELPATVD
ncbi:hypothetical protein OIU77_004815 [Salix suchowensis]|uniref:Uncharacterized protein n=1 Tax=Salix suchowensis TaxID=1278906 RepID=A0ABQ9AWV2_9ROSI|nr:hypothetical protein OIU77_004815 [Salix suchowensis]